MKYINSFNESLASDNIIIGKSSFDDPRDGKTYQTVILDNGREKVEWFAENLDYDDSEDFGGSIALDIFYKHDEKPSIKGDSDRHVCGRYYRFNSLKNACPEGWEIPKRSEFIDLFQRIIGNPPNLWKEEERRKIHRSVFGHGSILELHGCGGYEKPANYWYGTASFAGHKPNPTDFEYLGNGAGGYWSSTPGSLSNGGAIFIFDSVKKEYIEDVGYGYYAVRPIRKNI